MHDFFKLAGTLRIRALSGVLWYAEHTFFFLLQSVYNLLETAVPQVAYMILSLTFIEASNSLSSLSCCDKDGLMPLHKAKQIY